jgi:hypothetical protein
MTTFSSSIFFLLEHNVIYQLTKFELRSQLVRGEAKKKNRMLAKLDQ